MKPRLVEVLKEEGALHAPEVSKEAGTKIIGLRYCRRWRGGMVEFIGAAYPQLQADGGLAHGEHVAIVLYPDKG